MSQDPNQPPIRATTASPEDSSVRIKKVRTFGPGWFRRFAKLWGFLGFFILVLILARAVVLPFIFALLLAYLLSPVVRRMSQNKQGGRRMPRGVAILLCYSVLLAGIALVLTTMLPRITKDIAKLGREAPTLYSRLNEEWVPQLSVWLETKIPGLKQTEPVVVDDQPTGLPKNTQLIATPLPDGRIAIQMRPEGIELAPRQGGGYLLAPRERYDDSGSLEDRLRKLAKTALGGMQKQLGDVFRVAQLIITGVIRSVFSFFLVLMIAGFILLDLGKIHAFARGLIPANYRDDYDVITVGIDRGLSGVIRGQLVICLVNGVLTWIGLAIFDIKYALVLAVIACVLSLIPIFGSILSSIPIVLSALVSAEVGINVTGAVGILAWIIGIHFLEANLLNPKIIGTAAKMHPVLVIFSLIAGEHFYGLTGALLAVPVASIVQVLFLYFRKKAWRVDTASTIPPPVVVVTTVDPPTTP